MPVYEYEILTVDGAVRGVLEVEQKMADPPLARHPETGEALRRVLSATFARTAESSASSGCADGSCGVPASFGGCAGGSCGFG